MGLAAAEPSFAGIGKHHDQQGGMPKHNDRE
jgi:hypothetical protein